MKNKEFKFRGKVAVFTWGSFDGNYASAWRFVRVPEKISKKIKEMQKWKLRRGFGAVYVDATIGKSTWRTSIFPDWHSPTYILPLKKQIRRKENLYDEKNINVCIKVCFK